MIGRDEYVREKLQEAERQRARHPQPEPSSEQRRRVFAPIVRRAGHRIRHLGEALEAWAAPAPRDARG